MDPRSLQELIPLGDSGGAPNVPELRSAPILAALRRTGTSHVYADTADVAELGDLVAAADASLIAEVDGNTANQPLVAKVVDRYLEDSPPWVAALGERLRALPSDARASLAYAVLCARIGNDLVRAFGSGRDWQPSLQLHMDLARRPESARQVARLLQRLAPAAIVKVPFAPYEPECFLVARDLEREGISVNFTSTFSARQVVAAAALANVARTNVFMGRLSQGLDTRDLGEHVCLEAQRQLLRLRGDRDVLKTQLIAASIREWRSLVLAAGTDVFTAPCSVLQDLLDQEEVAPEDLESRVGAASDEETLRFPPEVEKALGRERIARLWRVEGDFLRFLLEYGATREYRDLDDGEQLARRFDEAGFGDFFHAPDAAWWREIRKSKLPDLKAPLTRRLALDTLYSLLADADFEKSQAEIDAKLEPALG